VDLSGAAGIGTDPELYALREAGSRMADVLNAAVIANGIGATGRWMAFHLQDGTSDKVIYDARVHAIIHQSQPCHFEQLRPAGYSRDECAMTLQYARALHAAGIRPDPDYPAPVLPVRREDAIRKTRQLNTAARRSRRANRR
jgi:hypothetical protein